MTDEQKRAVEYIRGRLKYLTSPHLIALIEIIDAQERECRTHLQSTSDLMRRLEAAERVCELATQKPKIARLCWRWPTMHERLEAWKEAKGE